MLVDTESPATDLRGAPLRSRERGADRLAEALATLGHDVLVREAPLAAAEADRWVVYFGADPTDALAHCGVRRRTLAARLVIVDVDRVTAAELFAELRVPLVVTSRSFHNWLANANTPAEVMGRWAVARAMGTAVSRADARERFVVSGVPLPDGIAHYCAAAGPGLGPAVRRVIACLAPRWATGGGARA